MKGFILCLLITGNSIVLFGQQIIGKKMPANYKPQVGKIVAFNYDPAGTKLEGSENIEAALFTVKSSRVIASDIKLAKSGAIWQGSYDIPDSVTAIALRFSSGEIIDDNNGDGYVFQVYQKKHPVKGSYAGKAVLYQYAQRSLGISSKNRIKALELYEKEFSIHPELKSQHENDYLSAMITVKKKESLPVVERKISSLLAARPFSEDSVLQAARFYSMLGMRTQSDSLKKATIEKLPNGAVARSYRWDKFQQITKPDSMLAFYQSFARDFKDDDGDDYSYMLLYISGRYIEEGRLNDALKHVASVRNPEMGADIYKDVAAALVKKNENLEMADSLAIRALEMHERSLQKQSNLPTSIPPSELKRHGDQRLSEYFTVCATVKAALKDTMRALSYQWKAVQLTNGEKALINEQYISYLVAAGENKRAHEEGGRFIKEGFATAKLKNYLATIYKDDVPFDRYVDSLEGLAREKMRRVIEKDLMNKQIGNFVLPSLDGKNISLADLKGKVVVVDFWATWCTPCKASFPGMQSTVNKYKNDKDVVFLFVDTWETSSGETRERMLKKFLNEHNYSFEVLLDQPLPGGGRLYKLAKDFEVEGIPTKFVVGRDGRIKFTSIGFKGDLQLLEAELSSMIEIAKKV